MADPLDPAYRDYYGRVWVYGAPSHMPAYYVTTPQDGPGNQVFAVSYPAANQAPWDYVALAAPEVERTVSRPGNAAGTLPGGLTGNADTAPYRNLAAPRWTDTINPPSY